MKTIIAFPLYEASICGFPPVVELTAAQARAMERIHLGGIEALCTRSYRTTRGLIDSLVAKGLLDDRGPTALGKAVAKGCAELALERATA